MIKDRNAAVASSQVRPNLGSTAQEMAMTSEVKFAGRNYGRETAANNFMVLSMNKLALYQKLNVYKA